MVTDQDTGFWLVQFFLVYSGLFFSKQKERKGTNNLATLLGQPPLQNVQFEPSTQRLNGDVIVSRMFMTLSL